MNISYSFFETKYRHLSHLSAFPLNLFVPTKSVMLLFLSSPRSCCQRPSQSFSWFLPALALFTHPHPHLMASQCLFFGATFSWVCLCVCCLFVSSEGSVPLNAISWDLIIHVFETGSLYVSPAVSSPLSTLLALGFLGYATIPSLGVWF